MSGDAYVITEGYLVAYILSKLYKQNLEKTKQK